MLNEVIHNANKLVGQKCWNAYNPLFGWIGLSFGGAVINGDPFDDAVEHFYVGEYSIYIDCQWRLDDGIRCLCSKASSRDKISHIITCLIGDSVTKIEINPPVYDVALTFTSGKQLNVFCDLMEQDVYDYSWCFRMMDTEYFMGINNEVRTKKNTDIFPDFIVDPPVIDISKQIEAMCQVNSYEIIQNIAEKTKTELRNSPNP